MDKQLYEFTYWLGLETEPEAEEQKLLALIAKVGGEVAEKVMPRKRRLAYPIEKQTMGSLGTIYFWLVPEMIPGLKEEIRQIRTILRSILLRRKKNALEPVKERRGPNGRMNTNMATNDTNVNTNTTKIEQPTLSISG